MQRSLSEQKVLNRLGIQDFRHMTKDKVMRFASMLPYMDPEVAKKALEQFPAFKEMTAQIVTEYKAIVDKALTENSVSQNAFYQACDSILVSLQQELNKETLSSEERKHIEDKMIEVAVLIGDKDSENKEFLIKVIAVLGFVATGIIWTAAAILGSSTQAMSGDTPRAIET